MVERVRDLVATREGRYITDLSHMQLDKVRAQLEAGFDPNERHYNSNCPPLISAIIGYSGTTKYGINSSNREFAERDKEIIRLLLEYGADPHQTHGSRDAFFWARQYGGQEIYELVNNYASIRDESKIAAARERGDRELTAEEANELRAILRDREERRERFQSQGDQTSVDYSPIGKAAQRSTEQHVPEWQQRGGKEGRYGFPFPIIPVIRYPDGSWERKDVAEARERENKNRAIEQARRRQEMDDAWDR